MTSRTALGATTLIAMAFVMGISPVHGWNNGQGTLYNQPLQLKLDAEVRKQLPDYFEDASVDGLLTESFYPIGWSKDGKFAYYLEPVDEACGCYFAKLFILDLKTDKVLWSYDYSSDDQENPEKSPQSLQALWKEKQKQFSDKLREYDIKPQGSAALLLFPIKHEGDQLTSDLKLKQKEDKPANTFGVGHAALQLSSERRGKKTVFEKTYTVEQDGVLPLEMKVLGYVQSPFEPRIALILIEVGRGYEGPPHVARIRVVGSSLTTGFK